MSAPRSVRSAALAAAALAAVGLAGCVSLLPKAQPVQLYRFGEPEAAAAPSAAAPSTVVVAKGGTTFEAAASTDRILAFTGQSAAYLSGAR